MHIKELKKMNKWIFRVSGKKEIIRIRAELNEIKNKKTEKIMKERSGTLKNNKIDEPLIRFTKEKK